MADLRTRYLGFELRTPLVASAGPLTGRLDTLVRLEEAGISAVVLPSLFEEELVSESLELHDVLELGTEQFGEALSYLPDPGFYEMGPERHAQLVASAKDHLAIPVIASVNARLLRLMTFWNGFALSLSSTSRYSLITSG